MPTPIGLADLRAAAVALLLFYVPGLPLARRLARAAGGTVFHWALPSSLFLLLGGLFVSRLLGLDLSQSRVVLGVLLLGSALLAVADLRGRRSGFEPDLSGRVRPAEWILIALAFLFVAATGAPLNIQGDSLAQITAIRRSLLGGAILPLDQFYRGGDGIGWDARGGFLSALGAVICRLSKTDPLNLWRILPAALVPGVLLAWSRLFRAWLGENRRADAALLLWILFQGGSGLIWLSKLGYPNHEGYSLAAFAVALWLEQLGSGAHRGRLLGVTLLLFTAQLIHLVPGLLAAAAMGFGLLALLADRAIRRLATFRRAFLAPTLASSAAALCGMAVPTLFRFAIQGPMVSTLHTHPQGLLDFGHGIYIFNPGADPAVSLLLLASLLLLPLALPRVRPGLRAPLLLLTLGPAACVITPAFALLRPVLGYLLVRLLEVVPVFPLAVLAAEEAWRRVRQGRMSPSSAAPAIALVAVAAVTGAGLLHVPSVLRSAARDARGARTPEVFRDLLDALPRTSASLPGAVPVVLCDPFTSYAVPAYTGAHVVSTLSQHGSPSDGDWRRRLHAQGEMLYALDGAARADSLLLLYQVDAVIVNDHLPERLLDFGRDVPPCALHRAMERFGDDPGRFPVLHRGAEGLVVAVDREGIERAAASPSVSRSRLSSFIRAAVLPPGDTADAGAGNGTLPVDAPAGDAARVRFPGMAGIEALDVRIPEGPWHPGTYPRVPFLWRRTGEVAAGLPLEMHLRCDTRPSPRWYLRKAWSKVGRLIAEQRDRCAYRFRTSQPPLCGLEDLGRLPLGVAVADSFILRVPRDAAPGRYTVRFGLRPETYLPNTSWADLLRDEEIGDGPVVGTIMVAPAGD